jgi:hypothetical protein
MIECQSFRQGCCGCCVNMRWNPDRVGEFLEQNTLAFNAVTHSSRPRFRDLVGIHWHRGGWRDHLLVTVLAPLTVGLTAWIWMRVYGSCCFAGYLDGAPGRVGCLIHPARMGTGTPDLRRHAFPLVPVLGCNRGLRCPMLEQTSPDLDADGLAVSRAGFRSLHS